MKDKTKKEILTQVKKTYDAIAEDFSNTRKNSWTEFNIFLKYIKDNDSLIDLACGNGRFLQFLKDKRKIKYLGIDNSKKLLEQAKKLTKGKFIEGDLLKIPAKTESTNVIACIAAFHHIPSTNLREKSLKEMRRILKKNGKLLLTVWNLLEQSKYKKEVMKAKLKWLTTFGKYEKRGLKITWGDAKIPRYYYAFKQKELEKLLNKYFKIIEKKVDKNLIYICEKL